MKPILLHPSFHKHISLRLLFLVTLISLFSIISFTTTPNNPPPTTPSPLPKPFFTALLHYATANSAVTHFSYAALNSIAATLRRHRPLNFLVFGLSHETLLWKTLNHEGRTVFIDESTFLVSKMEEKHPEIEAYDVSYSPKPAKLQTLIKYAKKRSHKECQPVQNLLYSECQLAIMDMPNFVYDVAWDVILVDGPKMAAAIFTASVLARRRGGGGTHVFVHSFEREVERVCSREFLCNENLVEEKGGLGHFVLREMGEGEFEFCKNKTISSLSHH